MDAGKKISILGCGWLGLPLAEDLVKNGFRVKGSTTTPAKINVLAEKGIQPFLIDLGADPLAPELPSFLNTEYLIVAFPPGIRAGKGAQYITQIKALAQALNTISGLNLLFISSTSVYPEKNKTVAEDENLAAYQEQDYLLQAESILSGLKNINTTILRLGGLVGGTRHPGRFLAGKQNVANPLAPVNLIHLDDCVALIKALLNAPGWGGIYNGVADKHPTRQEFYTAAAKKLNLPLPHFAPPALTETFKIISNEKTKKNLNYRFIHPDPMLFIEI